MSVSYALNKWFEEILSATRKDYKQRVKRKYSIGDLSARVNQHSAITHTYHQIRYANKTAQTYMQDVLRRGASGDLGNVCMAEPVGDSAAIADMYIKATRRRSREAEVFRRDLKREFQKPDPLSDNFKARLERYRKAGILQGDIKDIEEEHIRYLRDTYLPQHIRDALRPADDAKHESKRIRDLVRHIQDAQLREELKKELEDTPDKEDIINQFLTDRLAVFGGQVGAEVEAELKTMVPGLDIKHQSSMNKCIISLYYNMKQALANPSKSSKQMSIVRGLDRRTLPASWVAMVRPERASIALRHAVRMYASGLAMMAKGFREGPDPDVEVPLEIRGYNMIVNAQGPGDRKCFGKVVEHQSVCSQLTPDRTCAASALLLAYFEIMDTCMCPSPPLILRSHFRVQEFYIDPDNKIEVYDVKQYNTWSADKKQSFRAAYRRFQQRYEALGFTTTDEPLGDTKEYKLNFKSWGPKDEKGEDTPIVANPTRVREDTFLFRFLGSWRPPRNRLSIDQATADVWRAHEVTRDYDPDFHDVYKTKRRPIEAWNGITDELYMEAKYVKALTDRRIHLNHMTIAEYQEYLRNPAMIDNKDFKLTTPSQRSFRRPDSALAFCNIHHRWSSPVESKDGEFGYITLDDEEESKKFMFTESGPDGYGIQIRDGWRDAWDEAKALDDADKALIAEYDDLERMPLAIFPPPPLFNRMIHPLNYESLPLQYFQTLTRQRDLLNQPNSLRDAVGDDAPVWFNHDSEENDIVFPYPLITLSGKLSGSLPILPMAKLSKDGLTQIATDLYTVYPDPEKFWDIRISLACLLTKRGKVKLEQTITQAKKARGQRGNNNANKPMKSAELWAQCKSTA
uniref:Uncharacterized protein n=1 Tax=viral metagenome TaxID=1070528 RepID=A0A6C0BQR2_9ZZZZ